MKRTWFHAMLTLAGAVTLGAGCHAPAEPVGPTVATVPVETPETLDQLWDAAEETLLDYRFRVDRKDRQEGILTTHRETAPHWFEFWRPQSRSACYWAEDNLHTIQRQVIVHIRPTGNEGTYEADVRVDRYRYSLEERQADNAAIALRLYGSGAPTVSGETLKPEESSHWITLGRDGLMERRILTEIIKRHGKGIITEAAPPDTTAAEP